MPHAQRSLAYGRVAPEYAASGISASFRPRTGPAGRPRGAGDPRTGPDAFPVSRSGLPPAERAFGGAAALAAPRELVGGRRGPGPRSPRRRPDRRPAKPRRSRLRDRWQGQHLLQARSAPPGRGIGTGMRAAVLHLAFAGIDAAEATSGAFDDNTPSLTVSRKLGYQLDGGGRHAVRGRATTTRRLRLSRVQWQKNQRIPVSITGLARCRPLSGLGDDGRHELAAPATMRSVRLRCAEPPRTALGSTHLRLLRAHMESTSSSCGA